MVRDLALLGFVLFSGSCGGTTVADRTGAATPSGVSDGAGSVGDAAPQSEPDALAEAGGAVAAEAAVDVPPRPGWRFVWSDEFLGPTVDETTWVIADEPGNGANKELQYYSPRKNAEPGASVFIENGALVLEGREEMNNGYSYTSGKVTTESTKQFTYGRFEARMKLPATTGMWPAFWMLGSNVTSVGWPASGEIDIMEGKGRLPSWMSGALHRGPSVAKEVVSVQAFQLPAGNYHDTWHVFAIEWDSQQIRWYVDDVQFQIVGRPLSASAPWPFDQPFFFILNLAVGGVFDGNLAPPPGISPQRVYVDYVRVYQK